MPGGKRLIVNADDFGFTHDVNEGILEAHRRGILTSTTLMANGAAFDHAVRLAAAAPSLDIGAHLVLVGAPGLPPNVPALLRQLASGRLRIHHELDSQLRRIAAAGIRPSHLDTHKHTHLLPPVLDAVARLSLEHGIPWVRRPLNLPLLTGALRRRGCKLTDRFEGFSLTGKFHTPELVRFLDSLPAGLTEFMCHPGFCTEELRGAATRLKESRQRELEALIAPETRQAVARNRITLVAFREL